jgi:hypothetical protein
MRVRDGNRRQQGRRDQVKDPDDAQEDTPSGPGRRGQHAPVPIQGILAHHCSATCHDRKQGSF